MTTEEAINWAGTTQQELADMMGLTQGYIAQWGLHPPAKQQFRLAVLSQGELKVEPEVEAFYKEMGLVSSIKA